MALPDLRRLAIGTYPPIGAPWDVDVAELIAYQQIYQRIGAPEKHPHDALKVYDEMCLASERDATNLDFRAATPPACIVTQEFYLAFRGRNDKCRDVLMHIFEQYGWTSPTTSLVVGVVGTQTEPPGIKIDDELKKYMPIKLIIKCLEEQASGSRESAPADPLSKLTLPELRLLAELHAALYFRKTKQFTNGRRRYFDSQVLFIADTQWVHLPPTFCRAMADTQLAHLPLTGRAVGGYAVGCRAMEVGASFINLSYMNTSKSTTVAIDKSVPSDVNVARWLPERLTNGELMFAYHNDFLALGVEHWTMRNLTDAHYMFAGLSNFNGDLSKWEPSQLKIAYEMFKNCTAFEGRGLEKWAPYVTSIKEALGMFRNCTAFEGRGLAKWAPNVKSINDAGNMFKNCQSLKLENLRDWQLTHPLINVHSLLMGVPIDLSDEDHLNTMNVNLNNFEDNSTFASVAGFIFGTSHNPEITTMLHRVVKRWKAAPLTGMWGQSKNFCEYDHAFRIPSEGYDF